MDNKKIACLDVGTSGCRTLIYSADGKIITQAYEAYSHIYLQPGWLEHDPNHWLKAVQNTFKTAFRKLSGENKDVAAIAVISQRSTFIPVNKNGVPLANAILWQDKRSKIQAETIRKNVGNEFIYKKTGLRIDPYFSLPKLLWIKENKADLFQKIYKILTVHDFIIHYLTGKMITDWTQASRTMLLNINTFEWDQEICSRFAVPVDILPELIPPGTVIGGLREVVRQELGINSEIPVVAVGGDQQAAAVGLGVIVPDLACANSGTGSFILAHTSKPVFDPEQRLICTASALRGGWLLEASIITTGAIYRWFRDRFMAVDKKHFENEGKNPYERLNSEAENVPPGSNGLLLIPHFAGAAAPYWDPDALGAFLGLSLVHTRGDVIRSIFEGVAFEIKKNIEIMEQIINPLSEIRVSGGMSRSDLFNQIQADISGKIIQKSFIEESSTLGAMVIAAVSIGIYENIDKAVNSVLESNSYKAKLPTPELHEFYIKLYNLREELYQSIHTSNIYNQMKEIREELNEVKK